MRGAMTEIRREPDPQTAPDEALPDASAQERTADAAEHAAKADNAQVEADEGDDEGA